MIARLSGLVTHVQNLAPLAKWTHCMIHCESLASKKMPECLETVLQQAVQLVNLIKARPSNTRLLSWSCQELGAEHEQLLFTLRFAGSPEVGFYIVSASDVTHGPWLNA